MKDASLEKKNIIYIHILRIIACFLVVVNHTHVIVLNVSSSYAPIIYCAGFSLCKMAVAIFIIISAILMLDKEYSYKKILDMTVKITVPVLVLVFLFTIKETGITGFNPISFVKNFITEPYIYPYWYIYMLLGLYLVLPFLQKMVKNFKDIDYKAFIFLFLLIPCALSLINTYWGFQISEFTFWAFFPKVIGLAITGNYISKMKLEKQNLIFAIGIFVVSYVGMFLSCYVPYLTSGRISYALDSWNSFPVILMACSFVYIVRYFLEGRSVRGQRFICLVSKTTFGIYLLHMFVNWRVGQIGIMQQLLNMNCLLGIICIEIVVFAVCAVIVFVLEQIPIVKRFI